MPSQPPETDVPPYEQYQLRKVKLRGDARAKEVGADGGHHPWLGVGRERVWDDGLLISLLVTEALDRRDDKKRNHFLKKVELVDERGVPRQYRSRKTGRQEDSYVDLQNLWTFSRKHFDDGTDRRNPRYLNNPEQRELIAREIGQHLSWPPPGPPSAWTVGNIISLSLSTAWHSSVRPADVNTVRASLNAAGIPIPQRWVHGEYIRFPAVILASDQYALNRLEQVPWPFITVLPAVPVPDEVTSEDPGLKDDEGNSYVVLTACMLTLDYTPDRRGRCPPVVEATHPEFRNTRRIWPELYARIREQTLEALGIEVGS